MSPGRYREMGDPREVGGNLMRTPGSKSGFCSPRCKACTHIVACRARPPSEDLSDRKKDKSPEGMARGLGAWPSWHVWKPVSTGPLSPPTGRGSVPSGCRNPRKGNGKSLLPGYVFPHEVGNGFFPLLTEPSDRTCRQPWGIRCPARGRLSSGARRACPDVALRGSWMTTVLEKHQAVGNRKTEKTPFPSCGSMPEEGREVGSSDRGGPRALAGAPS